MALRHASGKVVEKILMLPAVSSQIKLNRWFTHLTLNQVLRMVFMCFSKKFYLPVFFLAVSLSAVAQKITHGIVVDSATLIALQGVHVKIKNSNKGTTTNAKGEFYITARPADTLVLSRIGYLDLSIPLLFEEADILIRLKERVRILKEITITSTRLNPSEIIRSTRTMPRKMSTSDAFSSPWEYFARGQRDKRKTVKLINENNRIRTYVDVIHDELLREDIREELGLSESEYYSTLAEFNKQSQDVLYSTDKNEIISSLKSFFRTRVR